MVDVTLNSTRFNIQRDEENPVDHLQSGYEGTPPSDGYTIPSCDLEDVDIALHTLFNESIGFRNTVIPDGQDIPLNINKPYVILAVGERFALVKKLRPPRDKSQQLLLPAIAIRRKSITQASDDINQRGINQFTGDLVIRRRLAKEDRDYQNLINKLAIDHLNPGNALSTREQGANGPAQDEGTRQGAFLDPKLGNNIWEIITIPHPQFYTASYEITFWTTHTLHMNYLISTFLAAQLPQGKMFRLNTPKGYWFLAHVSDEATSGDNFDDFKEDKRIIRYTLQMTVRSFLLAPNGPGIPVPVRRTISAAEISFETIIPTGRVQSPQGPNNPTTDSYTLTDIAENPSLSQTPTVNEKLLVEKVSYNPITNKKETKFVRILGTNQKKGETAYFASGFENLEEFIAAIQQVGTKE